MSDEPEGPEDDEYVEGDGDDEVDEERERDLRDE